MPAGSPVSSQRRSSPRDARATPADRRASAIDCTGRTNTGSVVTSPTRRPSTQTSRGLCAQALDEFASVPHRHAALPIPDVVDVLWRGFSYDATGRPHRGCAPCIHERSAAGAGISLACTSGAADNRQPTARERTAMKKLLLALACTAAVLARRRRVGADLSVASDHLDRAVSGRRAARHHRPHPRRADARRARPAGGDRERPGRGRQSRRRPPRPRGSRRLHHRHRAVEHARRQPDHLQAALPCASTISSRSRCLPTRRS